MKLLFFMQTPYQVNLSQIKLSPTKGLPCLPPKGAEFHCHLSCLHCGEHLLQVRENLHEDTTVSFTSTYTMDKFKWHYYLLQIIHPVLILGMCSSIIEAMIHISMHCQWSDTLKIHIKQILLQYIIYPNAMQSNVIWFKHHTIWCKRIRC